ncbi:hypothetical protein [Breznakia pachnodae]|uniref:Uncharacterized protein n=1 Tax=Breznakia pachnodae TaxID=265178 RepID=A0ABU0E4I8_9FIRM|nr:hypothetical protein [Breznakia pachnodae]MDQ0361792.1 hypothetical protein [Breznakia pachnodae]
MKKDDIYRFVIMFVFISASILGILFVSQNGTITSDGEVSTKVYDNEGNLLAQLASKNGESEQPETSHLKDFELVCQAYNNNGLPKPEVMDANGMNLVDLYIKEGTPLYENNDEEGLEELREELGIVTISYGY